MRTIMPPVLGEDGQLHATWFDPDHATATFTCDDDQFPDDPDEPGGPARRRRLCRTAGGRWALEASATDAYRWTWQTPGQARDWLITHGVADDQVARRLPALGDEHGPGRPVIGPGQISFTPAAETVSRIEQLAAQLGGTSIAVRYLIAAGLRQIDADAAAAEPEDYLHSDAQPGVQP